MIGIVFRLGKRAGCCARKLLDLPARVGRGLVGMCRMRPGVGVVVAPEGQLAAGSGEAVKDLRVEAFVAQTAVKAFDVAVLLRLAGVDAVPLDAVIGGPFQDRLAGELGAPPRENDPPDRFLIFVDQKPCRLGLP